MADDWRVFTRAQAGGSYEITGRLRDFTSLKAIRRLNRTGTFRLVISTQSNSAPLLDRSSGIVITRNGVTEFSGQVTKELSITTRTITAVGTDDMVLLESPTRPVPTTALAPFASAYDVRTDVASTVMRNLVNENIGPGSPPFWRIPSMTPLPADPLLGSTITIRNSFERLTDVLFDAAIRGGGLRFNLVQGDAQISTLDFNITAPEDRSGDAKFGVELGSARDFNDVFRWPEANYFIVAADDGFGNARTIAEGGNAASIAQVGYKIPRYVFMPGTTDAGQLAGKLQELIDGAVTSRHTRVQPVTTPSIIYGEHYSLGDLVQIIVNGEATIDLVREIEIEITPDGTVVTPIVGDPGSTEDDPLVGYVKALRTRLDTWQQNMNLPANSVISTKIGTGQVLANHLGAGQVAAAALGAGAIAGSLGYTPTRCVADTYVGDGTAGNRTITIGFTPKLVFNHRIGTGGAILDITMVNLTLSSASGAVSEVSGPGVTTSGFIVNGSGGGNAGSVTYYYVAIG